MKRAAEPGPSTSSKRPRPEPQAVAEAFPPDQKRRATDLCRKGSDGTGWIEGKVYQRGAPSAGSWEFILTAELGSRVQVLLSGSCSERFAELPIAVGAQVRIRTRGLVLEDLDEPPKLLLPKRFAWREHVTLHAKNPKTGEESFMNTWTASDSPEDVEMASTPTVPKKRGRTPPSIQSGGKTELKSASPPTTGVNDAMEVPPPSDPMLVDNTERTTATAEEEPVKDQAKSGDSHSDSQNPQSLPSPPPELNTELAAGEQAANLSGEPDKLQATSPQEHPNTRSLQGNVGSPLQEPPANPRTSIDPTPAPAPVPAPAPAVHTKIRYGKDGRRPTKNERKKQKQLLKAQQLASEARTDATEALKPKEAAVDNDGEEQYWNEADIFPDEALLDDIGQRQAGTDGGHRQHGESVERASSSAPVHDSPEAKPEALHSDRDEHSKVNDVDPLDALKMGCVSGFITYTPLDQLQANGGMKHIIGVVDSPGNIAPTKKSEFMLRMVLYDPTNYGSSGFSVALFDKAQKALPVVETGDILMLRAIQIDAFNGGCALGASYKGWQWAVFHTKTGMLSYAPADDNASRHFKPETNELQFSIRLGDWWRDVSSNAVSFAPEVSRAGRRGREHKLIADATDDEYFDCTVEVLHGFRNDNGVYSVFVTDYTRHPAVSPTQGEWCPPRLAPYVLRVEMWDSSADVGPTMQAGEYYTIRNLRTRIGGGGFLESKTQEGQKISKLDEDQLENQPRLSALLKRKRDWEADMNATGGVHEFPHKLVEEAEENCHFKCTVEVVHVSPKDDFTYLYVTDYTARADLVPVSPSIAPPALADRVVRVELRDAQVDTAKSLEVGDFVAIRNLRLRPAGGGALLAGRLGGDQRLITKLNPKANGNADLRALLSRKEEWAGAQTKTKREGKRTAARAARLAAAAAEASAAGESSASGSGTVPVSRKGKPKAKGKQFSTIADVKASEACPAVFHVRVRAVDFFPDDLQDCVILRCTSCDQTLPKNRRRCTKCDDAMEDDTAVAAFFQLWLRVADANGGTLDVSIADERCSVLQNLSPDDVYEDEYAFAVLVARVRPLVGDLLDVDDDEARRRPIAQDADAQPAPLVDLTIGSWLPDGVVDSPEGRAYVVLKHALCEDDT